MFATSSQMSSSQYEMFCINGVLTKIYQNTQPTKNIKIQKNNQNNKIQKNQKIVNESQELDEDQFQKQFNKMIKSKQDYNNIYKFYLENEKLDTHLEYKMDFIQYLTKCDNVSNDTIKSFLNDKSSSTSIEWQQFKQEILNCLIDSEQELEIIDLTQEPEIIEIETDSDYKPEIESEIEEEFEEEFEEDSETESEIEEEFEEDSSIEEPKDYCNICNDILLSHIYGNVCKKHIPSYALHDLEMYDNLTLKELDTLPSKNTKIDKHLLSDSLKFFQKSKSGMSINEKTLVFITTFKNGVSFYLNNDDDFKFKGCLLQKCNEIIYDNTFLQDVPKKIQNKLISYVKKIKIML
jgi:hypothetical protein